MNILRRLTALVAAVATLAFVACEEKDNGVQGGSTEVELTVSPTSVELSADGTAQSVIVETNADSWDFVVGASDAELDKLASYVHRTFNGQDLRDFIIALRHIVGEWGGLGDYFEGKYEELGDMRSVLAAFRRDFHAAPHDKHSEKHLSSIERGAACKRLCMYLRWMVRCDSRGVDFGLWRKIPMSALYMPLDVHTGRMGRGLGLLNRKQDDWKAVEELTASLRELSSEDPVRYDYSLFGLGISGDDI